MRRHEGAVSRCGNRVGAFKCRESVGGRAGSGGDGEAVLQHGERHFRGAQGWSLESDVIDDHIHSQVTSLDTVYCRYFGGRTEPSYE